MDVQGPSSLILNPLSRFYQPVTSLIFSEACFGVSIRLRRFIEYFWVPYLVVLLKDRIASGEFKTKEYALLFDYIYLFSYLIRNSNSDHFESVSVFISREAYIDTVV